jgi:SAM-dependent methyltransferase
MGETAAAQPRVDALIARWQGKEGGQERANYALFLTEFCDALDLPRPDPADARHERNDYVFERVVTRHRDEGDSLGRIDLYRKGAFVLEAKQSRWKGEKKEIAGQSDLFSAETDQGERGKAGARRAWDVLMLNAKRQAEEYARALPASHGWPPFVLTCDVGHCIEVYADFTGQGKNYTQFPDRQSFRVYLEDLRKPDVQARIKSIWLEPQSLDPTRKAAKATREIAERLAQVSKALEAKSYPAEQVAHFLMRCLFTMFASSVKLLPEDSFRDLLDECRKAPDKFVPLVSDLWRSMNDGTFAASIRAEVLQFNGNLFADAKVLPLGREEIGELYEAAQKDWHEVEPAIFGTLLEQALDPAERRRLGAHYTPRAYVERLVLATIIEPLREDWRNVQAVAETKRAAGDRNGAADAVKAFHDKLCETRVLDPACGTGNFLYVSMELMKRLEGEVLEALAALTDQARFAGYELRYVDPHQFLGLEINPRAAAIAELVLWIGYLQWHFRVRGGVPPQPILRQFKNIEVMNAVLTWDGYPLPQVIDGKEAYPNPKRPRWPIAEFIVGNPPFIGNKRMRDLLGTEFVSALRDTYASVPESVDLVMYWWDRAADLLGDSGSNLRGFGLVTTNSITQSYNRKVLSDHIERRKSISLSMAIGDHPWTKAEASAAVRIAMTVARRGSAEGNLLTSRFEEDLETDEPRIELEEKRGFISTDLSVGIDVTSAEPLLANTELSHQGVTPLGEGFRLEENEIEALGYDKRNLPSVIRRYLIGRDLVQRLQTRHIIDFYGLSEDEARRAHPKLFQVILDRVRPEREKKNRAAYRERFWIYAEPRSKMREALAGLNRYIVTCRTAKHRLFSLIDTSYISDAKIVAIASDAGVILGALSCSAHKVWAERTGAWLGVGNDSNYNHSECFAKFPFPSAGKLLSAKIEDLAQELDAFRKQRQKEHPDLTLTQMYNVLEKLRANATLDEDDEEIKTKGLILILKELHEKLDALVFEAYGWPQTLTDEQILGKLVALNHERAAEERRGHVRWLRPDYQIPRFGKKLDKQAAKEDGAQVVADLGLPPETSGKKPSFPSDSIGQTAAVFAALASATAPLDAATIASGFRKGKNVQRQISDVLLSLARLGHVSSTHGGTKFAIRRAA